MSGLIYKICDRELWAEAMRCGVFEGAPIDRDDGFIHFSTAGQVRETARRHFRGRDGLVLAAIDAACLGAALKYEPSRGGELFPHLYGDLPMAAVRWTRTLPLGLEGHHIFPELDGE